jgi:hypothetical protein
VRRQRLIDPWIPVLAALLGGLAACSEPADPARCLGSAELCDRNYDDVTFFTSHNAMSNEAEGWFIPHHLVPISEQLEMGVRALMLDVHPEGGETMLCHGTCVAGMQPLSAVLTLISQYLDGHDREVITLIFESYVPADEVAAVFEDAGLAAYAHTQDPATPWPTLGEMIDEDARLVVFTDAPEGGPPWMHALWDHAFETHFSVKATEDLSCETNRGDPNNALFILNHFLTNPFAHISNAEKVNTADLVLDRSQECWQAVDHRPNFVVVDYVSIGDVKSVVDTLNEPPPE